jgi:basic membrane protein A
LTSIEKKMAKAVLDVIKSGVDGTFTGGDENQYVGNLANSGVQISAQHDVVYPDGIQAELDALKADIISGKIVVASGYKK